MYKSFNDLENVVFDAIHEHCTEYLEEVLNTHISGIPYFNVHSELMENVIRELYRKNVAINQHDLQK